MNVLHISSGYDVSEVYSHLLGALNNYEVSNLVYVPNHTGRSQGNSLLYVDKNFGKIAKFLYLGEQRYLMTNIEQRIELNKISCVHAHRVMYGGYIGLELKKRYGIPYIVAVRNSDLYGFGYGTLWVTFGLLGAGLIICCIFCAIIEVFRQSSIFLTEDYLQLMVILIAFLICNYTWAVLRDGCGLIILAFSCSIANEAYLMLRQQSN